MRHYIERFEKKEGNSSVKTLINSSKAREAAISAPFTARSAHAPGTFERSRPPKVNEKEEPRGASRRRNAKKSPSQARLRTPTEPSVGSSDNNKRNFSSTTSFHRGGPHHVMSFLYPSIMLSF